MLAMGVLVVCLSLLVGEGASELVEVFDYREPTLNQLQTEDKFIIANGNLIEFILNWLVVQKFHFLLGK